MSNTIEIWKDIPGYEGKYQASNLGNIKSLNYSNTKKSRILKGGLTKDGYLQVVLYLNGYGKNFTIHRLIWNSFKGIITDDYQINHINEIKTDNKLINLEILLKIDNLNHGTRNLRISKSLSKKVIKLDINNNILEEYNSTTEAGRINNISNRNISSCCRNERSTAGGFKWKYK